MGTTPMTVHADNFLSNISVAYQGPPHIDEELFPVVPVSSQSDFFPKFSKQQFQDDIDTMAPGAAANDIEVDLEARGYYFADGHGYNLGIPDALVTNADPAVDLEIENTEKITGKIRLRKERNLAAMITTGNITQNATLSGTSRWDDYVNSDPVLAVEGYKETIQKSTGLSPSDFALQMSRPVFRALRNHPRIIDRFKYTVKPPLNLEQLAEVFEVKKIVLGESLYKTTLRGQTDTLDYVWGKQALLYYSPQNPGKRTPALGYTFMWTVRTEGGAPGMALEEGGGATIIKRWREEGKDSTMLGIRVYYGQQFIDANCGFLIASAIT